MIQFDECTYIVGWSGSPRCREALAEALHRMPRLCARPSRPAAAPADPAALERLQTPLARRAVSPRPAICQRLSFLPAIVSTHLEEAAATHLGPLAPRSDAHRITRAVARHGAALDAGSISTCSHQRCRCPVSLPMTALSSPRVLHLLRRVARRQHSVTPQSHKTGSRPLAQEARSVAIPQRRGLPLRWRWEKARGSSLCLLRITCLILRIGSRVEV